MFKKLSAAATAALMMVGGAQANLVSVIDLFNTPQARLTDSTANGFVVSSQTPAPGFPDASILGGYRELIIDLKDQNGDPGAEAKLGVSGGRLTFSTDASASATGIVRWDGVGQSTPGNDTTSAQAIITNGLMGLNIGNVFTDSFEIQTIQSDAGFRFTIEAYNSTTQWSKVELTSNAHALNVANPFKSYIPLIAFLDCGFSGGGIVVNCGTGGPVDFSNLGALQVVIDPDGVFTSLDLSLNQVTVVPEPNAIALVGLALLGAGVASRRRKV